MNLLSRMSSRLLGMTAAAALLSASAALAASGDLVVNAPTAPSTLDPAWACGVPDLGFLQNFYVRLVDYGIKKSAGGGEEVDYGSVRPYLAKSWTISDDGKTYTFKLSDKFKFSSGKPVDAAAVKYSFERGLKMGGCGQYFLTDGFLNPNIIEAIETPDATTVVIKLGHANANSLVDWATGAASIVDPSVIEANGGVVAGKPNEYMSSHVAGSGPYVLDSYTPNQSAHASADPNFAGEPPLAKSIQMNWISSAPTLLLQARSGQADITYGLSKQAVSTLKTSPDVKVEAFSNPFVQQMMLPNTKAPWDNPKVREAVSYAVPYEDIVKKVAFGYGTLYYGPVPPSMAGFNAEISKPIPFDLAKAKKLLADSGVKLPVDVEVLVQEGDSTQQQIATVLQSTWSKLGINLKIRIAPGAEYQDLTQAHKVQSLMRLDGPGVFEAGYYFGYDVMCKTSYNLTESCNPKIDELVVKLRATLDKVEHQKILDEITKLWRADTPKLLFFEDQPVIVLSKNVKSFRFAPLTDFRFMGK